MLNKKKLSSAFGPMVKTQITLPSQYIIPKDEVKWSADSKLGQGGSASVYKGHFKGIDVAVKVYSLDNFNLPENQSLLQNEVAELVKIENEYIIKCFGLCLENGAILLELAQKQIIRGSDTYDVHSLRQLIDVLKEYLSMEIKLGSLYQIAKGLSYLHAHKIVHGDLKSANVLVQGGPNPEDYFFKLSDFGQNHSEITMTRTMTAKTSVRKLGTVSFEAPEAFDTGRKSFPSDIYSYAMVIVELLCPAWKFPWQGQFPLPQLADTINLKIREAVIQGERPVIPNDDPVNTGLMALMMECWKHNPTDRPKARDLEIKVVDLNKAGEDDGNDMNDSHSIANILPSPTKSSQGDRTMPSKTHSISVSEQSPLKVACKSSTVSVTRPAVANFALVLAGSSPLIQAGPSHPTPEFMNLDDNNLENARSSPNISNNPKIVIESREAGHSFGFKKVEIKNRSVEQNNMDRVRRNLFRDGTNKPSPSSFESYSESRADVLELPPPRDDENQNVCLTGSRRNNPPVNPPPDDRDKEATAQCSYDGRRYLKNPYLFHGDKETEILAEYPLSQRRSKHGELNQSERGAKEKVINWEPLEMMWQGYASKHLGITLKPFQIEAMRAFHEQKDMIIIQATGSGKSACFYLPSLLLTSHQQGLVIVPTLALGENHHRGLEELKVSSLFLSASSQKEEYESALKTDQTFVIIVTPEFLFGRSGKEGIVDRIQKKQLAFIVIDEAHLVFDWSSFRVEFSRIEELKNQFSCPILALSATMKPFDMGMMSTTVLRDPVVIEGAVDRPNVAIHISPYRLSTKKEIEMHECGKFHFLAEKVKKTIQDEKTVVYLSYAADCDKLAEELEHLGLKTGSYTGKTTSHKDKIKLYHQFKNDDIQVLVATKAFGMGINIPNIRHVISVGLTENLALWMQEFGRAGRDGAQSHAHLFVREDIDMKKLGYWIKGITEEAKKAVQLSDFKEIYKYFSCVFAGKCLRSYILGYFDSEKDSNLQLPEICCTGCDMVKNSSIRLLQELKPVLQSILVLNNKGVDVYEERIVHWLHGLRSQWMWMYFNEDDLRVEASYGRLNSDQISKNRLELVVKGILRQCFACDYVSLDFKLLPGPKCIMTKVWTVTDKGKGVMSGEIEAILLPDPVEVCERIFKCELKRQSEAEQPKRKKAADSQNTLDKVKALLKDDSSWITLERRDQYAMLGYHHDTSKILYTADYTSLKLCPAESEDHLWKDIQLSKESSSPKSIVTVNLKDASGEVKATRLEVWKSRCAGVQVCEGGKIAGSCSYSLVKRRKINTCMDHRGANMTFSGECPGIFVYVRPEVISVKKEGKKSEEQRKTNKIEEEDKNYGKQKSDTRRWLLFLTDERGVKATHNHPKPVESKIDTKVKEDIGKAILLNPDLNQSDISRGSGVGYPPMCVALAAANRSTLTSEVRRHKHKDLATLASDRYLFSIFETRIKKKVDEEGFQNGDQNVNEDVMSLCSPYCRYTPCDFQGGENFAVLATPQMLEVLSSTLFVEIDVTYPGIKSFPYLLKMVSFNHFTMLYQPVARVVMAGVNTPTYREAIKTVMQLVTNLHPEFELGQHVKAWLVDFSLAQRDGLAANLGQSIAGQVIRGCEVHYQRNVKKVSDKVCSDEPTKLAFKKIAYAIPSIDAKEDVELAFSILCGERSFDDEDVQDFFLKIDLSPDDLAEVEPSSWNKAKTWAKWWNRPRIVKMFTKSFKEMSDADWELAPKTTNAVEAHNKISNSSHSSLLNVNLEHWYRVDRGHCYDTIAAAAGIPIGVPLETREKKNAARRRKRNKPKQQPSTEADPSFSEEASSDDCSSKKKAKLDQGGPSQVNDQTNEREKSSRGKPLTEDDPYIGKSVWILTGTGTRCRAREEWLRAVIQSKDSSNEEIGYITKFTGWRKKNTVFIEDILDENVVRFTDPCPGGGLDA